MRTDIDEAVVFATVEELRIIPCKLDAVATGGADATSADQ